MTVKRGKGRATLGQGLDREVYQIVRKLIDENSQYESKRLSQLSVPAVYDKINRSNSSLNRKSKKLLEDSIERVLGVLKDEASSNDEMGSIEGEFDEIETEEPMTLVGINKNIVRMWAKESPLKKEGSSQPAKSKKRTISSEALTIKRRKTTTAIDRSPPTHLSLDDLGGVDAIMEELEDLVALPLISPELYSDPVQPPRGILLHGPPGCGKTTIANALAAELGIPFIALSAPSIVSGMSGESEKALREQFEEAKKLAPCLLFIDEIDAITPKRESAQREMEKRIVSQLLTCMDDLALEKTGGKTVIVIAATNRPDSLDSALRRGGRFDKEINLGVPNEEVRCLILKSLTRKMSVSGQLDLPLLAKLTPGYVGADLKDLVSTAGYIARKRYRNVIRTEASTIVVHSTSQSSAALIQFRQLLAWGRDANRESTTAPPVTQADFISAIPKVQPSSKREGFTAIPDTTWADIGALRSVREELIRRFIMSIRCPEKHSRLGITTPTGVLLWGPPGCGKTLLAQAVAKESQANFIYVKGAELLNKYVGESERGVRQVFDRARSATPCLIFFDEVDALAPNRDGSHSETAARVVNTLLTELDGLSKRQGIYVIAATNRPDMIDPAILRPGRLGISLFVGLPSREERVEILKTLIGKYVPFCEELADIARKCDGFSGADLKSLHETAGYIALERDDDALKVEDFLMARTEVEASVEDPTIYERVKAIWGKGAKKRGTLAMKPSVAVLGGNSTE